MIPSKPGYYWVREEFDQLRGDWCPVRVDYDDDGILKVYFFGDERGYTMEFYEFGFPCIYAEDK
jgi:hypothetical protein